MLPQSSSVDVIVDMAFPTTVVLSPARRSRRQVEERSLRAVWLPNPSSFLHTRHLAAVRGAMQRIKTAVASASRSTTSTPVSHIPASFPSLLSFERLLARVSRAIDALRKADLFHDDSPEGRHYLYLRPRDVEGALLRDRHSKKKPLAKAACILANLTPFSITTAPPLLMLMAHLDAAYWRTMRLEAAPAMGSPPELAANVVNALHDLACLNTELEQHWEYPDAPRLTTEWANAARILHSHMDTYAQAVRCTVPSSANGPFGEAIQELELAREIVKETAPRNALSALKKELLTESIDAVVQEMTLWSAPRRSA